MAYCEFCGILFKSTSNNEILCDDCIYSVDELSDGKGDEDD